MKTYAYRRDDGSLRGFEISNVWVSMLALKRILRSVQGVSDVRRRFFSDDRIEFVLHGETCVVHEPFGDNSRYWIGPANAGTSTLDIAPLHDAFEQYQNPISR